MLPGVGEHTRLDRLQALLQPDDQRHPVWVLAPWSAVSQDWMVAALDRIIRTGAATAWWSWNLTGPLRDALLEGGFRVGIATV